MNEYFKWSYINNNIKFFTESKMNYWGINRNNGEMGKKRNVYNQYGINCNRF